MNKFFYLSGIFMAFQMSVSAQLDEGLVGSYPLAGDAVNVEGTLDDGLISGQLTATTDRFGSVGCALAFPGTDSDIITLGDANYLFEPAGAISVSLWYKGGTENISDFERLFSKGEFDWHIALFDVNTPLFGVGYNYAIWANNDDWEVWQDTNWHHLVAVYDNADCAFYADGELMGTMNFELVNSNGAVTIGRSFLGSIDDIRIYNRSLSFDEVQELYQMEGMCAGVTAISSEGEDVGIRLYPNPASQQLFVENTSGSHLKLIFTDVAGKGVLTANLPAGEHQIDIAYLPNGIYTVLSVNERVKGATKIIVAH